MDVSPLRQCNHTHVTLRVSGLLSTTVQAFLVTFHTPADTPCVEGEAQCRPVTHPLPLISRRHRYGVTVESSNTVLSAVFVPDASSAHYILVFQVCVCVCKMLCSS